MTDSPAIYGRSAEEAALADARRRGTVQIPKRSQQVTAVVAQTKADARELARQLVLDDDRALLFGATMARQFEGLRADLVLIDVDAEISDDFMDTIRATVLKNPGGGGEIRYVRGQKHMAQAPDKNTVTVSIELDPNAEQAIRAIARNEIDKRLQELRLAPIDLTAKERP
ncbi:hypothetical protein BH11ACT6_BH11ACT6_34790 [soil metagenome]